MLFTLFSSRYHFFGKRGLLKFLYFFREEKMKTNSSCKRINMDITHTLLPVVYISVFIIGLVANCWGIKSLIANWKKLGNINVFILNLGVADILYLVTLPFLVAYYSAGSRWVFGQVFCKMTRFCFNLNLYGSIGFLTCISVYRYLSIVHPLRVMGRINAGHTTVIAALVWILVCAESVPDMFYEKNRSNATEKCFDTTSNSYYKDYLNYSFAWTISGFCLPLLIILGCYGHVAVVLYSKKNNIDQVMKQRCLRLVFIVTLLFSVCYTPYHILKNLNLITRIWKREGMCRDWFATVYVAHQVSRALVCLNSAINPLIYFHSNKEVTMQIARLWERTQQFGLQMLSHRPSSAL
ncbi:P2Y purinoceptor 1-like [Esox lucius]|uniref:P2Y purinoceptor 1-like n=1 Tax=Esox lucius TaxID=8010 RepID=UPI000576FD56|nr:P2Y purinoceptor 1-like [Esox lucius]